MDIAFVNASLILFFAVPIILTASIGLSLLTNWMSPSGIPLFGQWDTSKGVVRADKDNLYGKTVFEIDSVSAAKKIYDIGKTLFVDARSADSYAEGHVKGAIFFLSGSPKATLVRDIFLLILGIFYLRTLKDWSR